MSDAIPPPKSPLRTWMRVFAWIAPGVAAPAILLGWFALCYGHQSRELAVTIGAIILLVGLVLGCAFFNAILRRPDPATLPGSQARSIALSMLVFTLFQVILVPAIGSAVATGCNALTRL